LFGDFKNKMDIVKAISSALLKKGTIYLPGIGTFERVYHSAELFKSPNYLTPPKFEIIFSETRNESDPSLTHYMTSIEKTGGSEIAKQVQDFTDDIISHFKDGKPFTLPDIGILRLKEDVITFEADNQSSLIADTLGFETVYFERTIVPQSSIQPSTVAPILLTQKKKSSNRKMVWFYIGLSILLAGAIIIFLYIMFYINDTVIEKYGNNRFLRAVTSLASTETIINKNKREALMYTEQTVVKTPVALPVDSPKIAQKVEKLKQVAVQAKSSTMFYLVAGSFKSSKNANRMKTKLEAEGFSPEVLSVGDSIFRVTLMTFNNRDSAMHEWRRLMAEGSMNSNVWLLIE
jgi:nucleoid DNA-binding protein